MRLIDAENLLKTIDECELTFDGGVDINELNEIINKQPTIPQWIPCSERLPEEYNNYLVTFDDEDVGIGTFHAKTTKWSTCDAQGVYTVSNDSIIAWMSLPEPYKEDKE